MNKLTAISAAGVVVSVVVAALAQSGRTTDTAVRVGGGPTLAGAAVRSDLPADKLRQVGAIIASTERADVSKALDAWREAIDSGDRERMEAARSDIQRAREQQVADSRKTLDEIRKVLDDEEYARFEGALSGPDRATRMAGYFRRLKALDLDVAQEQTIDKIVADAQSRIDRALTDEQRRKFAEATERAERPMPTSRMSGGLSGSGLSGGGLTDDQRAALEQIRSDYRDRINNAPPDQRRELYREMSEKIRQVTQPTDSAEPAGGD